ncbi:MAG: Nitrilase/cyanide hydratase and apolipoprotein N-acyltransferase [Myxococcaceae bacterium]|nr:Nitrilase/cyanide hydratase and apolipoprotein N-acyltransferase [Myxococcaceae bacterium]
MTLHIASCAYPIEPLADFTAFADKQARLVGEAARAGAQLLVFPEYGSVELTSTLPDAQRGALARELSAMSPLLKPMLDVFDALAKRHGVYILSHSFPERVPQGGRVDRSARYHNRAHLHGPSGSLAYTEKRQMTRFESEQWGVSAGSVSRVFDTELGTLGVAICYDSEFPLLVRRQVAAGADLILVPSCTDTLAGYHRVNISCRARALENQCYVVQASTVGDAPWSIPLDRNIGAAGVYGPVEQSVFPDGVVAQGKLNESGWVYADLDLAALSRARRDGQVHNTQDWDLPGHLEGVVERVQLG